MRARAADVALYREPELYDVAFGFRDVEAECTALLKLCAAHGVASPRRVLELACGPAHHAREIARRRISSVGIDISAAMLAYARTLCRRDGVTVAFKRADMRTFRLDARADVALCLFDSFGHCVSDRDGIAALQRTADALRRHGLLFLELSHPADYFSNGRSRTLDRWTERRGPLSVKTKFLVTRMDAAAETFVARVSLEARTRANGRKTVRRLAMRWLHRMWMRSAIEYVALASGRFEIAAWYGDLDPAVPLSSGPQAWRMVAVLRRR
ncbi:MAG: class I SAM-dependent methyltransferase [Candidatus Eremiobacter antarcticus]|nr:class I SAM-dependent methyltransferase [Candidatus Eremiobacteraeota bacterium]MBC5808959.1 class I SAM-dependent methyltransferase [Candidatus Eremiobacteraeota bacterium]